ncbi:MAG: hypothetical protein ACUVRD_07565 [Bacteroidia bacterium]
MKQALVFLSGCLLAQPVINSADLAGAGESHWISRTVRLQNFDFSGTGANYMWDYHSLPRDTQLLQKFESPTSQPQYIFSCGNFQLFETLLLPIRNDFPSPPGSPIQLSNLYAFARKNASEYTLRGFGVTVNNTIPITSCYQDPEEVYVFPIQYNDRDSTTFYLKTRIPNPQGTTDTATFIRAGYKILTVDGWGQIQTPYGTFQVLRHVTKIREKDTLTYEINRFPVFTQYSDTVRWEIAFLAQGEKIPILQINGFENRFTGNITWITAFYKDSLRTNAASLDEHPITFSPYPNPFREKIYTPHPKAPYTLYDGIGRVIHQGQTLPNGEINLPPLLPQRYYLRIASHTYLLQRE